MTDQSLEAAHKTVTRLEYAQRMLPQREKPSESLGTLLAGFAIAFGIYGLVNKPMIWGSLGIAFALVGIAIGGTHAPLPRAALILTPILWLIAVTMVATGNGKFF